MARVVKDCNLYIFGDSFECSGHKDCSRAGTLATSSFALDSAFFNLYQK